MNSVKNPVHLSYRNRKVKTFQPPDDGIDSFEIRPAFPTRDVNVQRKVKKLLSRRRATSEHNAVESVTGIPTLVELDEPFNCLDPGQLLRESAAAASRAALQSDDEDDVVHLQRPPESPSLVDGLLHEIYPQDPADDEDPCPLFSRSVAAAGLNRKDAWELQVMKEHLSQDLARVTSHLIQQLTRRDQLVLEREKHCDVITAVLQAASPKRSQDAKIRFSVEPPSSAQGGDSGFQQWLDAMRMVARLPGGVPSEFRRKLWLTLAEQHLVRTGVNWEETERNCFNDKTNPDDDELGAQIVRDLHRTGCSLFCGDEALPNQALLKRVLLAYARWNKAVGYCQGLNVLAALLLEVMNRSEVESLKVMIYLIEGVLPEGYYANSLRGLSVDMAVFRDLLKQRNPVLSKHLEQLQMEARDTSTNTSYEPPLTNVFTMQWFLTLFATCLPKPSVLRVWDLVFLEGNDVLLRTALAIWDGLADRILTVDTADDFYSIMGVLAREILEFGLMEPNRLVQAVVSIANFPMPGLNELRDKHRYNITPWHGGQVRLLYGDDDGEGDGDGDADEDEEKTKAAVATVFGLVSVFKSRRSIINMDTFRRQILTPGSDKDKLNMQLDIAALRKQYAKLRERQRQAHVIWTAATSAGSAVSEAGNSVSHLLAGRKPLLSRRPSAASNSAQPAGPRLKLPPPRSHPSPSKANSAPTTPSGKDGEPIRLVNRDAPSRRNSGATPPISAVQQQPSVDPSAEETARVRTSLTSTSRSRLAQELLEQNSAILQKMKTDRSFDQPSLGVAGVTAVPSGAVCAPSGGRNASPPSREEEIYGPSAFNPFPVRREPFRRPPKDVAVKMGLCEAPQKY